MTTASSTLDIEPAAPSFARRVGYAARLQATDPWATLIMPMLIMLAVFGLTFAIWHVVILGAGGTEGLDPRAFQTNGGITWIVVYMMVVAIQAMNVTFRFALEFSMPRKDYYAGTVAYFVGLSAYFALGITAFAAIERATDGWGVRGAFFAPLNMVDAPLWVVGYVFFTLLLFMFGLGTTFGTVFVRWRSRGVVALALTLAALVVGAVWLVTANAWWGSVGNFFTSNSLVEIMTWTLVPTATANAAGFPILRRATPHN